MRTEVSKGVRASLACLLEATARKPGNVHRFRDFPNLHYLDFASSAVAIGQPMDQAAPGRVGETVLAAIKATRRVVRTNTNLGMVLLLAPLCAVPESEPPLTGVAAVLAGLTVRDAVLTYEAIRLAEPGGMGEVGAHDLGTEPTVTLLTAMAAAASHDDIARQYTTDYADVRDLVVPALEDGLARTSSVEGAVLFSALCVLAERPDTLIIRKRGQAVAASVSRLARAAIASGSSAELTRVLDSDPTLNPGTTADLIAAGLYVAMSDGRIEWPRRPGPRDEANTF